MVGHFQECESMGKPTTLGTIDFSIAWIRIGESQYLLDLKTPSDLLVKNIVKIDNIDKFHIHQRVDIKLSIQNTLKDEKIEYKPLANVQFRIKRLDKDFTQNIMEIEFWAVLDDEPQINRFNMNCISMFDKASLLNFETKQMITATITALDETIDDDEKQGTLDKNLEK